jgi:hypothetical protein
MPEVPILVVLGLFWRLSYSFWRSLRCESLQMPGFSVWKMWGELFRHHADDAPAYHIRTDFAVLWTNFGGILCALGNIMPGTSLP